MKRFVIKRLLGELTPDIRAYLFPGLPAPQDFQEESVAPAGCCLDAFDFFPEEVDFDLSEDSSCAAPPAPPRSSRSRTSQREAYSPAPQAPDALDPRTEQILAEIRRLQKKYGVSIEDLDILLGYTVRLSRLFITHSGRIILSDYDNVEVKMPNISKALYFLFLRHPEGLRFKDIADHKPELLQIYQHITGRDDPDEIEKSIDLLVDPLGNALNVNASRIKTAFKNVISDRIARFYYLNGTAGEAKKVPLDRDLVIWDSDQH